MPKTDFDLRRFLALRILGIGGALILASLLPVLSGVYWLLEAPGHFRMQLAIGLVACCLGTLWLRQWKGAVIFGVAALMNASVFLPFVFSSVASPSGEAPSLRFLLFNGNSTTGDPLAVKKYLVEEDFDVVVLQEFNAAWKHGLKGIPYPHQLVRVREDNFGMALFSKHPFVSADVIYLANETVPCLHAEIDVQGESVHLLAVHPVPPLRASYAERRDALLEEVGRIPPPGDRYVIAGDFNTTPWSRQVRYLETKLGMENSAHGFGVQPTWPTMLPILNTILDHVLSRGLTVVNHQVGEGMGSDHRPIEITFELR